MICLARADTNPDAITCNSALGGKTNEHLCACRVAVEDLLKAEETRVARLPDSAREGAA